MWWRVLRQGCRWGRRAASGEGLYPHYDGAAERTEVAEVAARWGDALAAGEHAEAEVRVCGRVRSRREASRGLVFLDVAQGGAVLQVMASARRYGDAGAVVAGDDAQAQAFERDVGVVRRGDIVEVRGHPAKSRRGELSLVPRAVRRLAPCVAHLPEELRAPEDRARLRHVDLLLHDAPHARLRARAALLHALRAFLRDRGFVEVETPMLAAAAGGASAQPFRTELATSGRPLFLRISPELHLKRLVVGGVERVFELGKSFRNEGLDATHNVEFTMCELYMAYAGRDDVLALTEQLLPHLVRAVSGADDLRVPAVLPHSAGAATVVLNFAPPYARVSLADFFAEHCGLHAVDDWEAPDVRVAVLRACARLGVRLGDAAAGDALPIAKLLDEVVSQCLEKNAVQPTFLLDHPLCMSPLSKAHPTRAGYAHRFELFAARKELANAYSELNDPDEQRRRFEQQARQRAAGDLDAQLPDESFCQALEYGLPPTAGWGMGIDRLVMLLTGATHIREVQFP